MQVTVTDLLDKTQHQSLCKHTKARQIDRQERTVDDNIAIAVLTREEKAVAFTESIARF